MRDTVRRTSRMILTALLLLGVLFATVSCNGADVPEESSATTTHNAGSFFTPEDYYPSDYVVRDSWNIVLSIVEIQDDWIIIQIRDNDNLGFVSNRSYLLERLEGDEWVSVIRHSQEKLTTYIGYSMPAERRDYITTNTPIINPKEPGHYRVTKYLSDHPVTLEFDITE
ncbi:MAG: immunoglobulin-like domain-containing protein [Eubacteriales bacterium]